MSWFWLALSASVLWGLGYVINQITLRHFAPMELLLFESTIVFIIKKEYINQTKFITKNEAKLGIFDYIESWYNTRRIHSRLGYLTPVEFNALYVEHAVIELKKINKKDKIEVKIAQL